MAGRKLGQHFLYNRSILERIADSANISSSDTVVEIGPGAGTLTESLLTRAGKVIAIELDTNLYNRLRDKFKHIDNLTLVQKDALYFDYSVIGKFKVVANIPYYITTPIIFKLLEYKENIQSMTLTIQKEVADRILAKSGNKTYGALTLTVNYRSRTSLAFNIKRGAFNPPPKVDSAVVSFEILNIPPVNVADEKLLFTLIRTAFKQRRKTIHNSLKSIANVNIKEMLEAAQIDLMARAENLEIADFARLANLITG
ncbi:dimethyladenosine transferase [Candidatus Magnetoovum chiemensis]|nr:dimethyladenosine transferase [Candidatus Magnetoovum chiemensis]